MSPLRFRPARCGGRPVAFIALASVLALASAGCASTQDHGSHHPGYPQSVYGPDRYPGNAAPAPRVAAAPQVEVEDDGLPSQLPPPIRTGKEVDDPSEPFSPNYGAAQPSRRADTAPSAPAQAADAVAGAAKAAWSGAAAPRVSTVRPDPAPARVAMLLPYTLPVRVPE